MGLFDNYDRRQLKAVRRELKRLTRVINRTFRPHPPVDLRQSLELLRTNLVKFERDMGKGYVDVVLQTKMLRTWAIVLRREAMDFNRQLESRRFSWKRSPLERVFERLDRLDIAIYGLYGPTTKFQRLLTKLVQKSALTVYMLAQLAEDLKKTQGMGIRELERIASILERAQKGQRLAKGLSTNGETEEAIRAEAQAETRKVIDACIEHDRIYSPHT